MQKAKVLIYSKQGMENNMQMINVLKRLAELDAGNPNVIKESQSVEECGMSPMGGMVADAIIEPEKPSTPAALSITAGSGEELSNMLATLMQLAGVQKVGDEHMGVEPEPAVMTAEPAMSGPAPSAGDEIRAVLDKMHDGGEDGKEETDEGAMGGWDNSPNNPNDKNPFDSEEYANHENQPQGGSVPKDHENRPRDRNQPVATMEQRLMAEYRKFVAENKTQENYSGFQNTLPGMEDSDSFVNGHAPNYEAPSEYDYGNEAEAHFINHLQKMGVHITDMDRSASPVIVAKNGDEFVAWFDLENARGYIVPQGSKEGIEDRLKDLDPKNPVNVPAYQRKAASGDSTDAVRNTREGMNESMDILKLAGLRKI